MRRPYSLPLVASFTVVVLLLAACGGSSDESADTSLAPTTTEQATTTTLPPIDTATQLVDDWLAGWAAEDPDMVAAVFTDDGEYTNPTGTETFIGRDEIRAHAEEYLKFILNGRRMGDGVVTENGGFVFRIAFDAEAKSYEGESEVELRDDRIARMTWLDYEQVN
jgi:ketosteroid isomerase-like protein